MSNSKEMLNLIKLKFNLNLNEIELLEQILALGSKEINFEFTQIHRCIFGHRYN